MPAKKKTAPKKVYKAVPKPGLGKAGGVQIDKVKKKEAASKPKHGKFAAALKLGIAQSREKRALTGANALPKIHAQYFDKPQWGTWSPKNGGSFMKVVLGPGATTPGNYGSRPDVDTPSVMKKLKKQLPQFKWIAGHLLNDNLGGYGNAENLTPLTSTANKNHNGIELKIKKAVDVARQQLDKVYASVKRDPTLRDTITCEGIYYEVTVKKTAFKAAADAKLFAPVSLKCKAEIRTYQLKGQKWAPTGKSKSLSLPNGGVVINKK